MNHIYRKDEDVKSRLDPRVERSRRALRDALLALLEEQPFDQLSVRDITARAGAGYATFFRHYPDKASLLADLAAAEVSELLAHGLPILDAVDTRAACLALCSYVDGKRQVWSVLLTGGAAGNLREEFVQQARRVAAAHAPSTPRRASWLPDDVAVVFGVSGTVEILAWWLQPGNTYSTAEAAAILDRLVIAPILEAQKPPGVAEAQTATPNAPARTPKTAGRTPSAATRKDTSSAASIAVPTGARAPSPIRRERATSRKDTSSAASVAEPTGARTPSPTRRERAASRKDISSAASVAEPTGARTPSPTRRERAASRKTPTPHVTSKRRTRAQR